MHANRFTALLDACVLAPQLKCDILLSLADAQLFRARWSQKILDETEAAVVSILTKAGLQDANERAMRKRQAIATWPGFADCIVSDFDALEGSLPVVPDVNDRHIIAAALKTKASVIVTDNTRDFPSDVLAQLEIEAKTADQFIADAVDLSPKVSVEALAEMRARYEKVRPISADELLERIEAIGLKETAKFLGPFIDFL